MGKKAAVCFGDAGTVDCIGEPVKQLIEAGYPIEVFLDPKGAGKKALTALGVSFTEATEIDVDKYGLVISGTNGKAQILWKNATAAALKAEKPVVWCGDFYMSGCEAAVRDLIPTWLTTLDESARKLALRARPDLDPGRVVALGNASYDDVAESIKNRDSVRGEMRALLGLSFEAKIVYFAASASNQFDKVEMEATIHALALSVRNLAPSPHVIASFHPADPEKDELEKEMRNLLDRADVGHTIGQRVMGPGVSDFVGADVAVVHYSTEGVKSSLIVPTAFVLLPSMRAYQRSRSNKWPFFPQIEVGVAEGVWDPADLTPTIKQMFQGGSYIIARDAACLKYFAGLMDGGSTARIKSFLKEKINQST